MAPLPWWRVMTGASGHPKVADLCVSLRDDKADAYLFRLWDYCAEKRQSGRFEGANPGLMLERVLRFDGKPGALVEAMLASGLLDRDGEALVVHEWPEYQAALAAKFERDRVKPSSRARGPRGFRADSVRDIEIPRAEPVRIPQGVSPLSSLSVASEGVQGEDDAPALIERMGDAFKAARGAAYAQTHHDDAAMRRLLGFAAGDEAEVLRRWGIALAWRGFPACSSLAQLAQHWNHYAQTQPEPTGPPRGFGKQPPRQLNADDYREGDVEAL